MRRMQYVGRSNNIHWSPTSHSLCRILLGVKVVWNIRLKGDIFCLLADAWIFPRYINVIAGRGWVEQLPPLSVSVTRNRNLQLPLPRHVSQTPRFLRRATYRGESWRLVASTGVDPRGSPSVREVA